MTSLREQVRELAERARAVETAYDDSAFLHGTIDPGPHQYGVARGVEAFRKALEQRLRALEHDGWREVEPDWVARACDRAHASTNAARVGHTSGFCLACAELHVALGGEERPERYEDPHPVVVPAPCSLDEAFDGESEPQRRELRALERDVLCRLLEDVLRRVRETRSVDSLAWVDVPEASTGFVRLEPWEVPLLLNLVEALSPRSEANR